MVGFGQPSIADVSFRNPRHPVVGIHTLRLKDLYGRAPRDRDQHARHRVPVHLLALVTAGRASFTVDFESYPCRPGGLLWVRPGQFVGFPPPGIDATLVLFEHPFPYDAVGTPAIEAGPTRQRIVTRSANEHIVARTTTDDVVSVIAEQNIYRGISSQCVCAIRSNDVWGRQS